MKTLRSRTRAISPAIDSSLAKPGASRTPNFSRMRHPTAIHGSSTPKKPRATTTSSVSGGDGSATNGKASVKNKKKSKFYNKACAEKPTELFRTDLISNMTVTDSEPLNNQVELIALKDTWRKEWNEGVQVPIFENEDFIDEEIDNPSLSAPSIKRPPVPVFHEVEEDSVDEDSAPKFLARSRLLRSKDRSEDSMASDELSKIGRHVVQYELDDLDLRWLDAINAKLHDAVTPRFTLNEDQLEKAIERLEVTFALRVADEQQSASFIRQQADADAVCDVCRDKDDEDGNLLVFCDKCNVCVHQACYGIRRIPAGSWLCSPCSQELRPGCVLCPNRGGAMKPTKSGNRWAHVSCAVWIPEVEFENPLLKEPVTKIARIPEERWMLQCEICDQRNGACVQCDVRNCHVSYHVTCAQRAGWKVTYKDVVPEDDPTNVLESYCKKHSKDWSPTSGRKTQPPAVEDDDPGEGTSALHVDRKDLPAAVMVAYNLLITLSYSDIEHVFDRMNEIPVAYRRSVFYYWKTKRLSVPERNLIYDLDECQLTVERDREAEFICRRVDSLISLRQTLEKTRTLCYMVQKRERLKQQWVEAAAKEFCELSQLEETGAGTYQNKLKMGLFLETHSMGDWETRRAKAKDLLSLIPYKPVAQKVNSSAPIPSSPRKRGRPPKCLKESGTSSPLTAVNSPTPKKSKRKRKDSEYSDEKAATIKTERKSDDDEYFSPNGKRRRMPRIQYSPD